jgi:hypothetical protein
MSLPITSQAPDYTKAATVEPPSQNPDKLSPATRSIPFWLPVEGLGIDIYRVSSIGSSD